MKYYYVVFEGSREENAYAGKCTVKTQNTYLPLKALEEALCNGHKFNKVLIEFFTEISKEQYDEYDGKDENAKDNDDGVNVVDSKL